MSDSAPPSADASVEYAKWSAPTLQSQVPDAPVTVAELESIQKQAYQDGFQLGYKEGLEQINIHARHLQTVLDSLANPVADLDESFMEQLLALVKAICSRLVRREMKMEPGQIIPILREAASALPASAAEVEIHLHPEDAALVREALAVTEENNRWRLLEDPVIARGDCRLSSNHSQVDASLETRLNALMAQLLGGDRDGER